MGSVGLLVQPDGDVDAPGELRDGQAGDKQAHSRGLVLNTQRTHGERGGIGVLGSPVPSTHR